MTNWKLRLPAKLKCKNGAAVHRATRVCDVSSMAISARLRPRAPRNRASGPQDRGFRSLRAEIDFRQRRHSGLAGLILCAGFPGWRGPLACRAAIAGRFQNAVALRTAAPGARHPRQARCQSKIRARAAPTPATTLQRPRRSNSDERGPARRIRAPSRGVRKPGSPFQWVA